MIKKYGALTITDDGIATSGFEFGEGDYRVALFLWALGRLIKYIGWEFLL